MEQKNITQNTYVEKICGDENNIIKDNSLLSSPISQQLQEWSEEYDIFNLNSYLQQPFYLIFQDILMKIKELEAINYNLNIQQIELLKENNRLRLIELKFKAIKNES